MKCYPNLNPLYLQALEDMQPVFTSYIFLKKLKDLYNISGEEPIKNHSASRFLLHQCDRLDRVTWKKKRSNLQPKGMEENNDLNKTEKQMIMILNKKGYVVLKPSFLP